MSRSVPMREGRLLRNQMCIGTLLDMTLKERTDARGEALKEPDVRHGGGEVDVAHALAPDLRLDHLDAALLAHVAAMAHALVLAAVALVVLGGAEDLRAEEPIPLGLERAVIDRLGLL